MYILFYSDFTFYLLNIREKKKKTPTKHQYNHANPHHKLPFSLISPNSHLLLVQEAGLWWISAYDE